MSPDALIDELSAIVETTKLGAVIYRNAAGEYHRTAGPAVVYCNGEQHWYQNGVPHREDGPAIERPDGSRVWYLNNVRLTEEEFISRISSGDFYEP